MTDTLVGMSPPAEAAAGVGGLAESEPTADELAAIQGLVQQARDQGVVLTGPGGLLKALTKTVIEAALDEEMAEHLGYDKHAPEGRNRATDALVVQQRINHDVDGLELLGGETRPARGAGVGGDRAGRGPTGGVFADTAGRRR